MIAMIAIAYLSLGVGFALGMTSEALAREGHMFNSKGEVVLVLISIPLWLPFAVASFIIEWREARRVPRSLFMK